MYTTPHARAHVIRIPSVCIRVHVFLCVYVSACVFVRMYVCVCILCVRCYCIVFLSMQLRDSLYTRRSYVYMYRCNRFTYFTPCLAAFTSSWFALASHKDLLLIRIPTYTADAPHTTDYQIRTA